MKFPKLSVARRHKPLLAMGILLACLGVGWVGRHWAPASLKRAARNLSAQFASLDLGAAAPVVHTRQAIAHKDGMVQVYIPAGEFTMGTSMKGFGESYREHKVYLDAFWMDQTAVTNGMYAKCQAARRCNYLYARPGFNPNYSDPLYRDYPVTYVVWEQARQYCRWAGRRLPTEAEWEKAARGTNRPLYPWGNTPPDLGLLNFDDNIGSTVSVIRYPSGASPYDILQLEGNIREWMQDWYDAAYYAISPYRDPQGPATGTQKALRGASYADTVLETWAFIRFGHPPRSPGATRGFRCAESAGH